MPNLTRVLGLLLLAFTPILGQNCPGANYFNGQRCAPCSTNCQCTTENTCSSCLPGYTYDALFQNLESLKSKKLH